MALSALLITALIIILVFIISALPLHFSVKALNGKTTLMKTGLVTLISGVIVSVIELQFKIFGGILAFFLLIWIYHEMFRLKWWKAFVAWMLQLVFIMIFYAIFVFILAAVAGITLALL